MSLGQPLKLVRVTTHLRAVGDTAECLPCPDAAAKLPRLAIDVMRSSR